ALVLASKVRALLEGRYNVSFEDIRRAYLPALRHRVLLNFEAQAENIPPDSVLEQVLKEVKEKGPELTTAVRAGGRRPEPAAPARVESPPLLALRAGVASLRRGQCGGRRGRGCRPSGLRPRPRRPARRRAPTRA